MVKVQTFLSKNALNCHRQHSHKEKIRRDGDDILYISAPEVKTIHNIKNSDIDDVESGPDQSAANIADNFLNFLNIL